MSAIRLTSTVELYRFIGIPGRAVIHRSVWDTRFLKRGVPLETKRSRQAPESVLAGITEIRPWGRWTVLGKGKAYKGKQIDVNPGCRLSLQFHHHRSEHWIVVSGLARVTIGEQIADVHPQG